MDVRTILSKIDALESLTKINQLQEADNPYTSPADREKFDMLTPQDQAWLTAGGQRPDINDEFILNRAPNKGQVDPAKTAQKDKLAGIMQKVEQLKGLLTKAEQQKSAAPAQAAQPAAGQAAQPSAPPVKPGARPGGVYANGEKIASGQPLAQPATQAPAQQSKIDQNTDGTFTAHKKDGTSVTFDKDGKILSENAIAKNLVESFGYNLPEADTSALQYAGAAGAGLAKMGLAKAGAKTAAKLAPGVGTTLSAVDAWNRFKEGDRTGAVIAALAGVGWLIPGPAGWIIGGGLDAANIARDMSKGEPQQAAQPAKISSKADPKIVALQKYLVSQGAKNPDGTPLTVDGVMGKNTRAAMDAANLSESQKLEIVRMQLAEINEAAGWVGNAIKGGQKYLQGLKTGFKTLTPQQAAMAKNMAGTANKAGQATARAVKGPVGKIGALGAAGAAGYAAGTQQPAPQTVAAAPKKKVATGQGAQPTAQAAQPAAPQIDPELLKQIAALSTEIKAANIQDPAVQAVLSQADNILARK